MWGMSMRMFSSAFFFFFFLRFFESQILVQNNLVSPPNTFFPIHFMIEYYSVFLLFFWLSCRLMSQISFVLATQFWWLLFFSCLFFLFPSRVSPHLFTLHSWRTYFIVYTRVARTYRMLSRAHQRIIKFYTLFPYSVFSVVHVCS